MREPNTTSSTDSIRSTETLLVDKELALKDAANQESAGLLVDGGKEAWLFMVGSFMVDAVLWGVLDLSCLLVVLLTWSLCRSTLELWYISELLRESCTFRG